MNTGQEKVTSHNGLLTTLACGPRGEPAYALEGAVFMGGASIQWLRDELKLISDARDSEYFATKVDTSNGVYVVPAFTGLGAPYWDAYARGTIVGLTRGVNSNHIIRATLESIAYQTRDVLDAMQADSGIKLSALRVDGGAVANNFLMQFQADVLDTEVHRPKVTEVTALGAAYLAGLAVGFWDGLEELQGKAEIDRSFKPHHDEEKRQRRYKGWKRAVKCAQAWQYCTTKKSNFSLSIKFFFLHNNNARVKPGIIFQGELSRARRRVRLFSCCISPKVDVDAGNKAVSHDDRPSINHQTVCSKQCTTNKIQYTQSDDVFHCQ